MFNFENYQKKLCRKFVENILPDNVTHLIDSMKSLLLIKVCS